MIESFKNSNFPLVCVVSLLDELMLKADLEKRLADFETNQEAGYS
jgi:hypothetical protein